MRNTTTTDCVSGGSGEAKIAFFRAGAAQARRNQPEQAVGPLQRAAENSGVIVRALDDFHPATHVGVQADRVPNDHSDWILVGEQERQNLFADLTRWGGDHDHFPPAPSLIRTTRPPATPVSDSTRPLGHRTSILSATDAEPRPKCR